MELPILLKNEIDKLSSGYKQAQLQTASQILTERYTKESGQGKRLVTKDIEAVTYSIVRMPATFGSVSTALAYALEFFEEPISTVLDVGAGTGAASWAVANQIEQNITYTCIEREDAMISLGKKLANSHPFISKANWIKKDFTSSSIAMSSDLVIASYALNELDEANRVRVLGELWNATKKLLILVEPGTPVASRQIGAARKELIARGGFVVAPCPHNSNCPISDDDWCHFTCRIPRSKLHKLLKGGDAPYENEKFSFVAIAKSQQNNANARILRHPLKEAGRITLQLCTDKGIETKIVTKKQTDLFKRARKSSGGESL